ncbi:hypothetical protein MTO96_035395 [Rhipicephalus appendiculatus]
MCTLSNPVTPRSLMPPWFVHSCEGDPSAITATLSVIPARMRRIPSHAPAWAFRLNNRAAACNPTKDNQGHRQSLSWSCPHRCSTTVHQGTFGLERPVTATSVRLLKPSPNPPAAKPVEASTINLPERQWQQLELHHRWQQLLLLRHEGEHPGNCAVQVFVGDFRRMT